MSRYPPRKIARASKSRPTMRTSLCFIFFLLTFHKQCYDSTNDASVRHLSRDAPGVVCTRKDVDTMGQAVQSPLLPQTLSPSGADLSAIQSNAWALRRASQKWTACSQSHHK